MYVVRRAFRNYGQMMTPGSIVEPGSIKRFKSRLKGGYIISVHECDIEKWDNYFKVRFGVSIVAAADATASVTEAVKPAATNEPVKPVIKITLK